MKDRFFDESFEENIQKTEEKFNRVIESEEVSPEFRQNREKERAVDEETLNQLKEINRNVEEVEKNMNKFLDLISENRSSQNK